MKKAFVLPDVSDDDIAVVERLLGVTFDEPRRAVLRSNESFDVQACPGSGKTTLLVAKLAILTGKWNETRRGICVLSHTNVARKEIEQRLTGNPAGSRLLQYPHFVGTIHGFINQFLALPWLRSEGKEVRAIDDDICGARCRSLLYRDKAFKTAMQFLKVHESKTPDRTIMSLRFEGPGLELGSASGNIPCGKDAESYSILATIKKRVADEGFWRYDDMFAVAQQQLLVSPVTASLLRRRFPVVFIDEMQDTSEVQNCLLGKLLPIVGCELRQRYGDSNQAIFDAGQFKATSDPFPGPERKEIPNSKRFGEWIAATADPLAVDPISPSIIGEGPKKTCRADPACMPHTMLLFNADTCQVVLPAFGGLLLEVFEDEDLSRGYFRAVGHIGRLSEDHKHHPRSIPDYWLEFQAAASRLEPRPRTLAGYAFLTHRLRLARIESAEVVDMVAKGIIELVYRIDPGLVRRRCARSHRWIEDMIGADAEVIKAYRRLVWRRCIEGERPSERAWGAEIETIRTLLRPLVGDSWSNEAEEFVRWSETDVQRSTADSGTDLAPPNVFRFKKEGRAVDIHVGTIHSAKGQTHTATLVLETFRHKHDMASLMDWLIGKKRGWKRSDNKSIEARLRLIFTAMTRPTHLLCLAMRREVFGDDLDADPKAKALRDRGWLLKGPEGLP